MRAIVGHRVVDLADEPWSQGHPSSETKIFAVVDRLSSGGVSPQRLRDSLETAFAKGHGTVYVFIAPPSDGSNGSSGAAVGLPASAAEALPSGVDYELDGATWRQLAFSSGLVCETCGISYPEPEPRLFSFNSPLGACPACEGFGNVVDIDMELVVPDVDKTLQEGAIAPWNTPAYAHELQELLALAPDYNLRVDVPYRELSEAERRLILEGVPERNFGGLRGFFAWLERRKYKMHLRVFLSRWRSYRTCPTCGGARLRPEALAVRVGGQEHRRDFRHEDSGCAEVLARPRTGRLANGRSAASCSIRPKPGCAIWSKSDWAT